MVIIHLSNKQRRIISAEKGETLNDVFRRFCQEFSYVESDYEFQSYPEDDLVSLDMNINANRVKEVILIPRNSSRRGSIDSCYSTIHDSSPKLASKQRKVPAPIPHATETKIQVKTNKRSAPKPPVAMETRISENGDLSAPDIDIPPPPQFLPTEPAKSLHKSIECETENQSHTSRPNGGDNATDSSFSREPIADSFHNSKIAEVNEEHLTQASPGQYLRGVQLEVPPTDQEFLDEISTNCSDVANIPSHSGLDSGENRLDSAEPSQIDHGNHGDNSSPLHEQHLDPLPITMRPLPNPEKEREIKTKSMGPDMGHSPLPMQKENIDEARHIEVRHPEEKIDDHIEPPIQNRHVNSSKMEKSRPKTFHASSAAEFNFEEVPEEPPRIPDVAEASPTAERRPSEPSATERRSSGPVLDDNVVKQATPRHYWELPKQGKTMQFLSRALHTVNLADSEPAEATNVDQRIEPAPPTTIMPKPVQITVQEDPVEQSDRPTYRPRQAKKLYFTAGTK